MSTTNLYFLIVNYNSSSLIENLLNSLVTTSQNLEQIIIVNNSPEDTKILTLSSQLVKIIESPKNLGFGQACNLGLNWIYDQNNQAITWLINPDTYFPSVTIAPTREAIAFFEQYPQISILGTAVYDDTGKITSAGGKFTAGSGALTIIESFPPDLTTNYLKTDWVSGCSLLINLANFTECPQFDPRYFLYYEDLDFCLRYGQSGKEIAVTPLIKVFHHTSAISDRNILKKYQYITCSYLIHIEKYGNLLTFIWTNLRMLINTLRLLVFKPQQGLGKLLGIYNYWLTRVFG